MIQVFYSTFVRTTLICGLFGFLAAQSQASIVVSSPSPKTLVTGGTYQAATVTGYLTAAGPTFLSSVSFFDIFTELSTDSGAGLDVIEDATVGGMAAVELPLPVPHTEFLPYTGTANSIVWGGGSAQPPVGLFDTEMLSLSLAGVTLGTSTPIMIRESPTLASFGSTMVTDLGGGSYHIDSFFDVFTELSLDGGATWAPSMTSTRFDLVATVPIPAASWLFLSGLVALGSAVRRKTNGS